MTLDPDDRRTLARTAKRIDAATRDRDEAIRQAVASGASSREVAEVVGLSHTQVIRIAKR